MAVTILLALAAALAGAAFWALRLRDGDRRADHDVWLALQQGREAAPPPFHPDMVAAMPEIARRYFHRAIKPGTPLSRTVELKMKGEFLLGDKRLPMCATQILSPPAAGFV